MSKNIKMILAIVGFTALLVGAVVAYNALNKQTQPGAEITQPQGGEAQSAADFTVTDAQGNPVRLSDFRGRPVVLNFWSSWCPPCRQEMPEFDRAHGELGDEVVFMMVNLTDGARETVDAVSAFIREQGYGFPVYFDTQGTAADAYGIMSIPATFFIDGDGNIVFSHVGALSGAALKQAIEGIR